MYGVAGEKRPIFVESDAFLHNLGDPIISVMTQALVSHDPVNPFIHYCSHVVTKFNARVIYTYGI
jgi:hypothetical protein